MLGCFNPNLGQIWTNPNDGLKMQLKKLQFKLKVEVGLKNFYYIFNPTWVCPYFNQIWVQTIQHCLERNI